MVSTTTPPRTNLTFPKIPVGLVNRGRLPSSPTSQVDARQSVGDLVYSLSSAKRQQVGNNARQYEIGQILEFDVAENKTVAPMLVTATTETQHNTNVIDYAGLGLDTDDQDIIAAASLQVYNDLTLRLNEIKQQRADAEMVITTQQKIINEVTRTISALQAIYQKQPADDVKSVIDKLVVRRDTAVAAMNAAIDDANALADSADVVVAELRTVAVVLK